MNLLFIQGGSRWKYDVKGNIYTDSNFHENIWNRYRSYCDQLTVILRQEKRVYMVEEASKKFNLFDTERSKCISLPDLYRPVKNNFNYKLRRQIVITIKCEVKKADYIIIRSLGNVYTNTALYYARKYNKPYLVEVTGFVFEALWYHSFRGKIVACYKEHQCRILMKDVSYAVYVTNEALQKRYPCKGKMLGCSDVEIPSLNETILKKRLEKINNHSGRFVIGTAAFLDVRWKGQEYVIRALAELRKKGVDQFEYQLIGAGKGEYLKKIIDELKISDCVNIIGAVSHDEVFEWMDNIDIYIQPSFMEGLCRSLVEAMSRACPIVCSDVGGNYELANKKCLFKKANYKQLAGILERFLEENRFEMEAIRSFNKARNYNKQDLDIKRTAFYKEFISE